jgi:sn-glycerol 3-phosphate transport system permease protein
MIQAATPVAHQAATRPRRGFKLSKLEPYIYLAPALVLLLVFKFWPMVFSLVLSVTNWKFTNPNLDWVGLTHYAGLFRRDTFTIALQNTPIYVVALAPFYLALPLILAVLLSNVVSERLHSAYKAIIFSPSVLSFAITCMVWMWMFNPVYGILNQVLGLFGLPGLSWLSDSKVALWSIVLVSGWRTFGYNMVLFLAALSAIPNDYLEAAQIDGASGWQLFWKIKWPLLSPTTFFMLVTTVMFAAERAFIPINILTRGGPYQATTNLSYAIYLFAFNFFDAGLASAAATLTFVLFLVVTIVQIRYLERYVTYDA